ncbi:MULTISPECIES: toll/interleukin-1 receptor domain-containing protein [unclassified Microbacterium]|uniref:toll/interleukin-1 receptor domain-containing protein n=1 Tax=unclassified Microbacterium TaxID=2609290 RepID=UPI003016E26E
MTADIFISYAWTSAQHRQWVRLLAIQLKALGYDVLLDADVDYGDSLTGFMRRVTDARHVLLIVDTNYVERADTLPESGVGKENRWISEVYGDRLPSWLSVVFIDNPRHALPAWLTETTPKGLDFNFDPDRPERGPGAEQIEDLWRWLQDLPANRDAETSMVTLRERAARLERAELRRDPSQWHSPALEGEATFRYADAQRNTYTWGFGDSEFALEITGQGADSIYVYRDPAQIAAVGIAYDRALDAQVLEAQLSPGRTMSPSIGQSVVLLNQSGRIALVDVLDVQDEETAPAYVAPFVTFRWRVIDGS